MNESQSTAEATGADFSLAASPRAEGLQQELRPGRGAEGRRPRAARRRGRRPGRGQRRRQVDPDQGDRRASSPPTAGRPASRASWSALHSPQAATRLGIATVYQDLALCDNLDVVANLFLGQEVADTVPGVDVLDETAMEQKAVELLVVARGDDAAQRADRGRVALRRPAPGGRDRALAARRARRSCCSTSRPRRSGSCRRPRS